VAGTRYTTLAPAQLADEFSAIAHDAASVFSRYDATQLNWQPHAAGWSIAQCFDHLLKTNQGMLRAIDRALDRGAAPTVWQRLPLWPRLFGWMLVTSQGPGGTRRYVAPAGATPGSGSLPPDTLERFIVGQQAAIAGVRALSAADARRIMVSPFVAQITYSVLDGYRLIAAHQRRHFEQASRVARDLTINKQ
jgi:hypothetical protein